MEKTMLQPVEGGAALDLTSAFSKVKVQVNETHKAIAKIFDNALGAGASINVVQTVS